MNVGTGRGLVRWSKSIQSYILSPRPQSAPGSDPSAFSIFPLNHVILPQSTCIYDSFWQLCLGVFCTAKVFRHCWHLSATMSDVKSLVIHSFVERLSRLTHILETIPPAFYQVNDIVSFASYFASKRTCDFQYGAGLVMASTAGTITRYLIHTQCQSCVYKQIFNIFWASEKDYWCITGKLSPGSTRGFQDL